MATTHLKARFGALMSKLRNEQGGDLLDWLQPGIPTIICGDFNAEPSEPVYNTMTNYGQIHLKSAYSIPENPDMVTQDQLEYTTWKVRESGEQKHILDYIFHTSKDFETVATLDMPTEEQIGENRLPSLNFPSDHLTLVADIRLNKQ